MNKRPELEVGRRYRTTCLYRYAWREPDRGANPDSIVPDELVTLRRLAPGAWADGTVRGLVETDDGRFVWASDWQLKPTEEA